MISQAGPKGTAIASWDNRAVAIICVLGGGVLAAWVPFEKSSWPQWARHLPSPVPAIAAYLTVVAIALAWLLYRGCRLGVRLDDHGVTIRRLFQTQRYGWPEVSRLADGCKLTQAGYYWALNVVLNSGKTVTLTATARKDAKPETLAAIAEVAAQYQIPADLTGVPKRQDGSPGNSGLYRDPDGEGWRQWNGTEWSPFVQARPLSGEVWSPLRGSERPWHDEVLEVRRARTRLAVVLLATAGAVALTLALYAHDFSEPHPDYSWAVMALCGAVICLVLVSVSWSHVKERKKIERAAKVAAGLAEPGDGTVGPSGDPAQGLVASAAIADQPYVASGPATPAVQIICPGCDSEATQIYARFCARCGTPLTPQPSLPAHQTESEPPV